MPLEEIIAQLRTCLADTLAIEPQTSDTQYLSQRLAITLRRFE